MSESIWDRGLPASFFTRGSAMALGGLIGGVAVLIVSGYVWLERYVGEPDQAPACYGEARPAPPGEAQIVAGNLRNRHAGIDEYTRRDGAYLDRMLEAHKACPAAACAGKAWEDYCSALFWYVSTRLTHMSKLQVIHGESGIRASRQTYDTPADREIERGLRERYRAKVFRLNDFSQNREAIAILTLKGGEALRPCRQM